MNDELTFSDYVGHWRAWLEAGAAGGGTSAPPPKEGNDRFNSLALELFQLQFRRVPAYQRLCQYRGLTPPRVATWEQIPAVPTLAFKELELTSLSASERTTVFHSSGTTGQVPSRHYHHAESLAVYEASLWAWFRRHLLADDGLSATPPVKPSAGQSLLCLSLTPPPAVAPHSSLVHMFETVRVRCGASGSDFLGEADAGGVWSVRLGALRAALERAGEAEQAVMLLGTAFNYVQVLDHLVACNARCPLPAGSRLLETGGYKGRSRVVPKAELHGLLADRFGVSPSHVVCEYGMSELSSQAYDTAIPTPAEPAPGPRRFRFPPWARARIISPETGREVGDGETGVLQVIDLANVRSVLAVQTEDLAVRRGDGFDLLGRARAAEPRGCSLMSTEIRRG